MKKAKSYIDISQIVLKEYLTLGDFLSELCEIKGGFATLDSDIVNIFEIQNYNGFSGYNYWIDGQMIGQLHLASLKNGWYSIYKKVYFENELSETYSFYDQEGNFSHTSEVFSNPYEIYESLEMDTSSPFVNHLYNVIANQYELALKAESDSKRIELFEQILNKLLKSKSASISATDYREDEAYKKVNEQILYLESDKVLRWSERQNVFQALLEKREKVIKTKKRIHSFSYLTYIFPFIFSNILLNLNLIKKRPVNNLKGLFYKYTIGKIIWFLSTVKENLGYSVALAIYGPFTFYFITQPMNPHAMWVVGEVRDAYISTTKSIGSLFETKVKKEVIKDHKNTQDQVSTKLASAKKFNSLPAPKIEWKQRMDDFKAMHIAHESNLIFSERMGRLEQIETQLNFPLAVEGAWNEITRYQRAINGTLTYVKNLDSDYRNFLKDEMKRSTDAQVYLWERMAQFFIDYPYILVDQSDEQTQKNAYTGRAFVFMQKMTDSLSKVKTLAMPTTHKRVSELAAFYNANKVKANSTLENLKLNSKLFASNDLFNTDQFRSYMKRHWEVLFLQQNKKQEASSFGMQAYSASIKNAIWTLQSLYSTKRDDHLVLSYKFNLDNQNTDKTLTMSENNELIENLLHFITFDYVSIKKEFSQNLRDDKEARLREKMINNIKEYAFQRDSLLNKNKKVFVKTLTDSI